MDPDNDTTLQPVSPKNCVQRLIGICMEPTETMLDIAQRPTWLFPLILSLLLVSIPLVLNVERVPRELRVRAQAEQAGRFSSSVDTKKLEEQMLARSETTWTKYTSIPLIFVFGFLATLAIAGILLGALLISGCQLTYKNTLAAYCWTGIPPLLVMTLLAVLFLFLKDPGDLNPLDPMSNIISHLGVLVDAKATPVLHSALSSLDIFSFWRIFLLGLGLSLATFEKTSLQKGITIVVVLWFIYVLGKVGLAAIF